MKFFARLRTFLKYTVQYACITHCTFEYVGDFVLCNGPSMEPTLFSKNILLTERFSRLWRGYKSGDIVIAISPLNADQYICKRIVAVSGEKVMVAVPRPLDLDTEQGRDSMTLPKDRNTFSDKPVQLEPQYVPRGCIWLEGDNKNNSSDSRYYGAIPLGLVKSRVVCRIWPLSQLQLL